MALCGSSFCCNLNVMDIRKFNLKPCSSVDGPKELPCFPPVQTTKCNLVFSTKTQHFPGWGGSRRRRGRPPILWHDSGGLMSQCCRTKSEDIEGALSGEGVILAEQTLMRDLEIAIEEEDYARAAEIRDNLRVLHEDSQASVLAANAQFYEAFRAGNLAEMQTLWSKGENVCCVHPGASGISGYDYVMESWEAVWMNYEFPLEIEVKGARVHVRGDVGYVSCMEFVKSKGGRWGGQFVTNVFERVDGQWFICVHHASPVDL